MIGLRVVLLMGQMCHEGAVLFLSGSVIAIVLIACQISLHVLRKAAVVRRVPPPTQRRGDTRSRVHFFSGLIYLFFYPRSDSGSGRTVAGRGKRNRERMRTDRIAPLRALVCERLKSRAPKNKNKNKKPKVSPSSLLSCWKKLTDFV